MISFLINSELTDVHLIMRVIYHYIPLGFYTGNVQGNRNLRGHLRILSSTDPPKENGSLDNKRTLNVRQPGKQNPPLPFGKQKPWDWPRLSLTSLPIQIMLNFLKSNIESKYFQCSWGNQQ